MPQNHFERERVLRSLGTRSTWALVLAAAAGCLFLGILDALSPPQPVAAVLFRALFPGAAAFETRGEPLHHYRALDTRGRLIGIVIISDSLPPAVKGYLGEIGSAVGITPDGRIVGALPVRHSETPYYMEMIAGSGLWETLAGLDLSRPFPSIDSVSGATVSSRAILKDIREASSRAARLLLAVEVPPPAGQAENPWTTWRSALLALLLALSLATGYFKERTALREGVMLANLIGIGFALNTPLTLSALSRIMTLKLPGPENTLLILILVYILMSVPLQGRAYCRLVCPFGTLQQLCNRLSPLQLNFSPGTAAFLPEFRRLVLALVLFLGVWIGWNGFTEVEPFFSLFSLQLTPILWTVVIFILIMSVFVRRFWCNTMCPTGTLLSMLSRIVRPGSGKTDETV